MGNHSTVCKDDRRHNQRQGSIMTIQSAIDELTDHGVPEVIALLRHLEAEMGQMAVRNKELQKRLDEKQFGPF